MSDVSLPAQAAFLSYSTVGAPLARHLAASVSEERAARIIARSQSNLTICAVSMDAFGARGWRPRLRTMLLSSALEKAVAKIGLPKGLFRQFDDDEVSFLLISSSMQRVELMDNLVDVLAGLLGVLPMRADASRIRLRVAFHAGSVCRDKQGAFGGDSIATVRQMLRSKAVGEALDTEPRTSVGLIVSSWWYETLIEPRVKSDEDVLFKPVPLAGQDRKKSAWLRILYGERDPVFSGPPVLEGVPGKVSFLDALRNRVSRGSSVSARRLT